jgi:acyl-CoA synthetase (AMP-forming)/AMP-acid ligase II
MPSEIVEAFTRVCTDRTDQRLLVSLSEQRSLTADAMFEEFAAVRAIFAGAGIGARELIVSVAGNRAAFFAVALACFDRNVVLMPADRGTTLAEAMALVDRWQASGLVLAEMVAPETIGRPHEIVALPGGLHLIRFTQCTPEPQAYAGGALLKLTSGSTGLPKATCTSERNLLEDTQHITQAMTIGPCDVQLGMIPISHAYGFGNLVMPLFTQGSRCILRDGFVPPLFASDAGTCEATVMHGVPFMFEVLIAQLPAEAWPPSLQRLISAGARLEPDTIRAFHARFGVKIHSFYGASEAGGICFDDGDDLGDTLLVGRPMPGVRVTLRPGEPGAPPGGGRVHVAGSAVAAGYAGLSGAASAQEGFVEGGFLTGDLGVFDDDGRLVLTGRVSSFINVAGRKVQPDEVEQTLRQMPGIADVRVLGAPDAKRGQMLVACLVGRTHGLTALEVRRFCSARLAAYKIPREYLFLDEMPRDERGKTSRRALEALVADHLGGKRGVL